MMGMVMMQRIYFVCAVVLMALCPLQSFAESWLYEDGGKSKSALILCHGKGGDPESFVVDPLRLDLNEEFGLHTISLQMPGGIKALAEYKEDFPAAYREIDRAVRFLQEKGINRIVLIAHSLGSRMATSYLAEHPQSVITAFVGIGMLNNGGEPFDCLANLRQIMVPVLDIWGEDGHAGDNQYGLERKVLLSPRYTQVVIAGGNHALSEHEDELVKVVAAWLKDKI